MTTTPNPTATGLVYRVLKGTPGAVQKTDEVIAALRAAGLLVSDPQEPSGVVSCDYCGDELPSVPSREAVPTTPDLQRKGFCADKVVCPDCACRPPMQEPRDSGRCGGCRDLGPHRNVPGCDYYTPKPTPSSDSDPYAAVTEEAYTDCGSEDHGGVRHECRQADALAAQPALDPEKVAEVLRGYHFIEHGTGYGEHLTLTGVSVEYFARAICEAAKRGELT